MYIYCLYQKSLEYKNISENLNRSANKRNRE